MSIINSMELLRAFGAENAEPAKREALSCDGRRLRVLRSVGAGAQGAVFVTEARPGVV